MELYTFEGEVVLDPFMGSGTTAAAALKAGRHYVGYDVSPKYCAAARERLGLAEKWVKKQEPFAEDELGEPKQYLNIARANYERFLSKEITNQSLRRYFDACFQEAVDHYGMYSCWSCVECLRNEIQTVRWGNKPTFCPICNSTNVYEVATFQGRAPIVGAAFLEALITVLDRAFQLKLLPSPPGTRTHDLELPNRVAVEVKGSPTRLSNPDGTTHMLDRPGLERSDTQKKAFDNARAFRQVNPKVPFYIASNAVPSKYVGYWDEHVSGIIDVTKSERLEFLVGQIKQA